MSENTTNSSLQKKRNKTHFLNSIRHNLYEGNGFSIIEFLRGFVFFLVRLFPERKQKKHIHKSRRRVKIEYFFNYLILTLGLCVLISVIAVTLMKYNAIPSSFEQSGKNVVAVVFFIYIALVFTGSLFLYEIRRSTKLFYKTSIPAFLVFLAITCLICILSDKDQFIVFRNVAKWCLFPLRCFKVARDLSNLASVILTDIIVYVFVYLAYLFGKYKRKIYP